MTSEAQKFRQMFCESLSVGTLRRAVLSKPASKSAGQTRRIDVRPVTIGGEDVFQLTIHTGNQHQHRNLSAAEVSDLSHELVGREFLDCSFWTDTHETTARFTRKGGCTLRQKPSEDDSEDGGTDHNRTKQRLLGEGTPVPFLVETGIMSSAGRVKAKHFHKFRQINRYLEFINDIAPHLPQEGPVHVVDFGCGKSYLTFAVHYLLTEILSRTVHIIGLDRRTDVVRTCQDITRRLQLQGLEFREGDIAGYKPDQQIHLAISLHACDTATDDALAVAANWNSNVILAVPCCQHELASKLARDRQPVLSRHGILHERFSSLATDALRASLMEEAGYRTQVLEFIETEHTPRNLLIRSVRRQQPASESAQKERLARLTEFSASLQLPPLRLERKLKEYGLIADRPGE